MQLSLVWLFVAEPVFGSNCICLLFIWLFLKSLLIVTELLFGKELVVQQETLIWALLAITCPWLNM